MAGQVVRGAESCGLSKRYARQFMAKKTEELYARKLRLRAKADEVSVSEFVDKYLAQSKISKARNTYENFDRPALTKFKKFAGGFPLLMVGEENLIGFRDSLGAAGYAHNTVRIMLRCVRAAFGYAKERGWIDESPTQQFKRIVPPKQDVARYIKEHEIEGLLRALPELCRRACYFALLTGMRRGEIIALDWKMVNRQESGAWEINLESHTALGIKGDFKIKTRRPRTIPLKPQAQFVMGAPREEGQVFVGLTEGVLSQIYMATKKLKLGRIRFHDFRHTWATNFMWEIGNIFELLRIGGWSSLESAKVYQHYSKRQTAVDYPTFSHYFPTNTPEVGSKSA